jgi:hypothetical protein
MFKMNKLLIREFSFQAQTEFERHVSEDQADLPLLADKMLAKFPYALRPDDIRLLSEAKLYDYRLVFKLFNGSADVTVTSKNVIMNFRDGRTEPALKLVSSSTDQIYKITASRAILYNQVVFSAHAQFETPEAYGEYMAKHANPGHGYLSGGIIIQAESRSLKGELRFSTEKSAATENGLFITAQFFTPEALTAEVMEKMAKRFIEVAGFENIVLAFT